jgi:hypothetical protein
MRHYVVIEQQGQVRLLDPGPFEERIDRIREEWNKHDVVAIIKISRDSAYAIETLENDFIEWTRVKP